jgi:hypothetical protein
MKSCVDAAFSFRLRSFSVGSTASTGGMSVPVARSSAATVSFIVPAHNAAATLKEAVCSALQQTYEGPIEVCVFDDLSTDGTARAAEEVAADCTRDFSRWPGPRTLKIIRGADLGCDHPQGPAFGRNRAVECSSGSYLCLLDADDIALPHRVEAQLALALTQPDDAFLIGGGFTRDPPGSTASYTAWANSLPDSELVLQQWRECTIIQPTWFFARSWYDRLGGWDEDPAGSTNASAAVPPRHGPVLSREPVPVPDRTPAPADMLGTPAPAVMLGTPAPARGAPILDEEHSSTRANVASEDSFAPTQSLAMPASCGAWSPLGFLGPTPGFLGRRPSRIPAARLTGQTCRAAVFPEDTLFFHRHLHSGGRLLRVPSPVIVYRYSATSQSWATSRGLLLATRVRLFEERVLSLPAWESFTIWGAGRDGKAFYNALSPAAQRRVAAFADIDPNKVGKQYPQVQRRGARAGGAVASVVEACGGGRGRGVKRPRGPHACVGHPSPPTSDVTPAAAAVSAALSRDDPAAAAAPPACTDGGCAAVAPGADGVAVKPSPTAGDACAVDAPAPVHAAPIVHYTHARPPIVCCVAMQIDSTDELQTNVQRLGLTPGVDFWYFC